MVRRKLAAGDLFEIPAPDGRTGYGQIIVPGKLLYVVVFEGLFRGTPPPCDELARTPLLIGWTMDALIYHGRWKIVRSCPVPSGLPFPNYKVNVGEDVFVTDFNGKVLRKASDAEAKLLTFRASVSPIVFQDSLLAYHQMSNFQLLDELSLERAHRQCIIPSSSVATHH
jgi:hypothetical protein